MANMKHVSILVPQSAVIQAIADPKYCFDTVNRFLTEQGKKPYFITELVGLKNNVKQYDGTYTIHTNKLIQDVRKTDLIIIPALSGDLNKAIELNRAFIPWIIQQYQRGAEIAALCLGAFLLAETGLLNGKRCSTHWNFQNLLQHRYPEVHVQNGHIVTEEKGIYSSGGAHFYWNLLLHLIEKYTNRELSVLVAKYFAIGLNRESQLAYSIFQGQKEHQDDSIREIQEYIEQHVDQRLTVEDLAQQYALGRRSLERRFKAATNNTVLEYIQRVKIEAAKRLFESSRMSIKEVMFEVGYTDLKAFRIAFKKITGLTPIEYKQLYNKLFSFAN